MPRTKRPVRKEKSTEDDGTLKKVNKLVMEQKKKLDARAQMEVRNVELAFKILLGSISNQHLEKTVHQLKTELQLKEVINTAPTSAAYYSTRSGSHDDGYLTENSSQGSGGRDRSDRRAGPPPTGRRSGARRSRSACSSARPPRVANTTSKGAPAARQRSRSVYRTPAYNRAATVNYPAITPKVAPDTPLTVLRQPRMGEMVLSMSGSPVMVPTCSTLQQSDRANCNILLKDGTVLSVQPSELRRSRAYIPFALMDGDVVRQLETLRDNLDTVVRLGRQACAD